MRKWLLPLQFLFNLMLCGCSSRIELEFHETYGEKFTYVSPVTAVVNAGDSLLLGTSRGDIVSFNLSDGSFRAVYKDASSRFVYQIVPCTDSSFLYSVQNGGINHVNRKNGEVTTYKINAEKRENYSAYSLISDGMNVYAATSNGVYHWTTPSEYGKRMDASALSDDNDVVSSRFYTIQAVADDEYVCAGESGLYSFKSDSNPQCLISMPFYALHGDISLSRDGKLFKSGNQLASLHVPALDFVCDGEYIYALSHSAVEILKSTDGCHVATVNLPKQKSLDKNVSCRSFVLIHDGYLYITPGGCGLYRMPLYGHDTGSNEVMQLCKSNDAAVYLLTLDNDLYEFEPDNDKALYRRSFEESSDVRLIGGCYGKLLVTIAGRYYELSGRRLTHQEELYDLNAMNRSKVLWHLVDENILYQGQVDKIRAYDALSGWRFYKEFERDSTMNRYVVSDEYYPKVASFYGDSLLVMTMHNGAYSFHPDSESFKRLSGLECDNVKSIAGVDNVVYALNDESVTVVRTMSDDISNVTFSDTSYEHFTDVVPLTDTGFLTFSSYSEWCKGLKIFQEKNGSEWVESRFFTTQTVHAAVNIQDYVVAGGSRGLDVISEDGVIRNIVVHEPAFFQKNVLAWNYPWGMIIYMILMIVASAMILWCIVICRRYYMKFRYARTFDAFYKWVKTEFHGSYVRKLARQLKYVSGDYRKLQEDISVFKEHKQALLTLQDIMTRIEDIQRAADIQRPRRPKNDDSSKYKEKLYNYEIQIKALLTEPLMELYEFCVESHPFGYSIIKEWGVRKGRGLFLMLAPLSPKIRFLEMSDPDFFKTTEELKEKFKDSSFAIARPGSEKVEFKSFMDRKNGVFNGRKLEIRDLIALAAYEAVKSENTHGDAQNGVVKFTRD